MPYGEPFGVEESFMSYLLEWMGYYEADEDEFDDDCWSNFFRMLNFKLPS